jgi:hypothetical protein
MGLKGGLFWKTLCFHQWMAKRSHLRLLTIPRGDFTVIKKMGYDKVSSPKTDLYEKNGDYVRHRAFELVAAQVKDIPGNVAEVGVFMGEFATLIAYFLIDNCFFMILSKGSMIAMWPLMLSMSYLQRIIFLEREDH